MDKYILDEDDKPIPCPDVIKWAEWIENHNNRIVAQSETLGGFVSTVFLGIDHGWSNTGPPILWETMVFDSVDGEQYQTRYTHKEDALEGHKRIVGIVSGKINFRRLNRRHLKTFG